MLNRVSTGGGTVIRDILLQQVEHQVRQTFHLNPEISEQFIESATLDTNYRSLPNIIELNNFSF